MFVSTTFQPKFGWLISSKTSLWQSVTTMKSFISIFARHSTEFAHYCYIRWDCREQNVHMCVPFQSNVTIQAQIEKFHFFSLPFVLLPFLFVWVCVVCVSGEKKWWIANLIMYPGFVTFLHSLFSFTFSLSSQSLAFYPLYFQCKRTFLQHIIICTLKFKPSLRVWFPLTFSHDFFPSVCWSFFFWNS